MLLIDALQSFPHDCPLLGMKLGFRCFTVQQQMYDWKYFNPAAALQTRPDLLSVFFLHSLTLIHPNSTTNAHSHTRPHRHTRIHTLSMFQNAWWPIYYWRGTPTDKQIPRNEVIWPGHVYTNTAEGFYGCRLPVSLYCSP